MKSFCSRVFFIFIIIFFCVINYRSELFWGSDWVFSSIFNNSAGNFFTKATQVEYLKEAKSSLIFDFKIEESEFEVALNTLLNEKKYEHWFTVYGVDTVGKKCVEAKVQAYLRLRN